MPSGLVALSNLPEGYAALVATAVSNDGSVLVGSALRPGGAFREAFRLSMTAGAHYFVSSSDANGVSGDGRVVVGATYAPRTHAFRWTQTTGIVGLGLLYGDDLISEAYDASADGSVIVGHSLNSDARVGAVSLDFNWRDAAIGQIA